MKTIAVIYLIWIAGLSVFTFFVYGWDKRQARVDGWRTPEKKLHGLSILGGWPGAWIGQRLFRHKTQKLSFTVVTWAAAGLHVVVVGCFIYVWLNQKP